MEILDVVNENDEVIGNASREDIYKNKLRHRIVHVIIFNDKGEMALQLRTNNVDFCPNHWSTTVGGHVQKGETYEQGALREFEEELGVSTTFEFLSKEFYKVENSPDKFVVSFKTIFNGPFKPNLNDVKKVEFLSLDKIKQMIEQGEKFHPELLFLLKKHFF